MPPAPHTCEYYTTETTAHHAAMLSDTLRNHAPAEDTMLALSTCHIHRRVMGEDSPFNDNHATRLRVFSYMSTPTTPLRLTFLRVDHDTWDEPRGFIRIHAGACTDDALPLTLSQTETTITDPDNEPGFTLNIPTHPHPNHVLRCTLTTPRATIPHREQPGVDYLTDIRELFQPQPEPGTSFAHDAIRTLLPYQGLHLHVWADELYCEADITRRRK
ncbi:hypothetical protein FQN05_10635 [Corynebacterium aurimucosum]|uniref:Uncharacterized protein n=1 Tax=Corynebacterium aurimucosum TaxID=169292 RepID=A0A558IKM5_9CORY|nr:hypothetical protein [Corynebacterium aurimucosum]TVU81900.1 hypothetical protein FQN05_10635 [Corynebacterium aurimucosum]